MAPYTLDTVESSALTGLFGAVIGFPKLELLPECHFVKQQNASWILLGRKTILSRLAGDLGKVNAWMMPSPCFKLDSGTQRTLVKHVA